MGVPLVNVEAVTPSGLALHVWRSMRPFDAGRLVSRQRMVLVLASHLGNLAERQADLLRPSLARVAAGVESDRMAGRNAEWARKEAHSSTQHAYADLFEAYETHLGEYDLLDMADVQQLAVESSNAFCRERDLDALLVCCETPVLSTQTELLETLGRAASTRLLLGNPRLVEDLDGPWARNELGSWSFASPAAPSFEREPSVLQAATRRDEVWTVLSDIVDRSIPFDDVELVVSDLDTYGPMIEAACRRLHIPTTLRQGQDDALQSLRDAVADYLNWVASGYQARHLADLLRRPSFMVADPGSPSAHRLAVLLEQFQLTPAMLSRPDLESVLEEGAERNRISFSEVKRLIRWMEGFRKYVPEGNVTPDRFGQFIRKWVERHWNPDAAEGSAAEGDVVSRYLDNLLDTLDGLHTQTVESGWLSSFLKDALQQRLASQDFGNGIHVVAFDEAGYGPRGQAYVMGLDDQASGSQSGQDATHIAGLDASRPDGFGRPIPARRRVEDLLRRFQDRMTTSVPAWDVRASRSLFPGSALVEAAGLDSVDARRRTSRLDAADAERQVRGSSGSSFDAVARGLYGQTERNSGQWTAYDGVTGSREGAVSLRLSPSRMEQYLACPYRYFLSSILGLEGIPEDGEEWLDRAAEGSILHDLFENHTRARVRQEAGIELHDEQQMLASLHNALHRQAARSAVDPEAFLDARYREMAHGVHRYFDRERRLAGKRKPVHAEFSFSDSPRADAPPAVYRSEDGEIILTGRVDRIDETDSGDWIIVDFKTGKPEGFIPDRLLKLDEKLQWALYAWAVQEVGGHAVTSSEYVFTSRIGAGWASSVAAPAMEQVGPLFATVLERIKTGHFIPAPDEQKTCTWCDFKAICGDLSERKASIQVKFNNADPAETEAFEGWAVRDKNLPSS